MVDIEIEVPAVDIVLADEPGVVGLIDGALQTLPLAEEFAAHIDVANMRRHGGPGEKASLDQQVRIVAHDVAVLAGARLELIGIDHEIVRPVTDLFGHEGPLESGWKTRSAATPQARGLDLIDHPVAALVDEGLGVDPAAALLRGIESRSWKP